ncbi:MAG TPA: right-handed parallel beta-helix repeat-containing protein, partial [Planctomycetota bacterium]|nr:right-handed parallel beta-helix repeat-containing protein [Planctomycetota bacterium]
MRLTPLALLLLVAVLPAAVLEVGPGQAYTTIAALPTLVAGDTVNIHAGTYQEVKSWTVSGTAGSPITIRGVGATRPLINANGLDVSGSGSVPRAAFQIQGSYLTIEHLEFANARNGNNGAGIRITGGATNVTVRDCRIHDNDMGMMSDTCDAVLIENSEIDHNGTSSFSGYSHNFYMGGTGITIRGCYIHDASYGQNVKSRAHFVTLLYNRIADSQDGEVGLVDENDTTTANSNAVLIGNTIISKNRGSGWNSARFILFGAESGHDHNGTLYAINNTCIAGTSSITFFITSRPESGLVARNNVFVGSNTLVSASGAVVGSGNWAQTGATIPAAFTGTVTGAAPGFVSSSDFHLAAGSACIDIGTVGAIYLDGSGVSHSAAPTSTYKSLGVLTARSDSGVPDAGAYAGPSSGGGGGGGSSPPPTSSHASSGGG